MLRGVETIMGVLIRIDAPDHLVPFINFNGHLRTLSYGFQDTHIQGTWATNIENRVIDCTITIEALTHSTFEGIELCAINELENKLDFWRKYR